MRDFRELDGHVLETFRSLNTAKRCEFVANFPIEGTTLTSVIQQGTFGHDRATVSHYLKQYEHYIDRPKRQDKQHRKILTLNQDGKHFQKVARYMVATAYWMNQLFDGEVDYLGVFISRSDPGEMIRVVYEIFVNGVGLQSRLLRNKGDRNTWKLVDRLSRFGLIDRTPGKPRISSRINTSKVGVHYARKLLFPVLEYLAGDLQGRSAVQVSNGAFWDSYVSLTKGNRAS